MMAATRDLQFELAARFHDGSPTSGGSCGGWPTVTETASETGSSVNY